MCQWLCESQPDGYTTCQNCARMIYEDCKVADDMISPPLVTSSGDLYCRRCGIEMERAEESEIEEDECCYDGPEDFDDE